MATKPKGVKPIKVEEVKVKTSSVDNTETHDSKKQPISFAKPRKSPKCRISHHRSRGSQSPKVVVTKDQTWNYVDRKVAEKLVATGNYSYGKKSDWKKFVRDATEPKLLEITK